jgi:hypothetical protein
LISYLARHSGESQTAEAGCRSERQSRAEGTRQEPRVIQLSIVSTKSWIPAFAGMTSTRASNCKPIPTNPPLEEEGPKLRCSGQRLRRGDDVGVAGQHEQRGAGEWRVGIDTDDTVQRFGTVPGLDDGGDDAFADAS